MTASPKQIVGRSLLLRTLGLTVATIVLMLAAQFILLSFETTPLVPEGVVHDIAAWARRRPLPGAGILAGLAMSAFALWSFWCLVRSLGGDRRTITVRRQDGWTKIDRTGVERLIERALREHDPDLDPTLSVGRRGEVEAEVVTSKPTTVEAADELRAVIDRTCSERSLPCRPDRITMSAPVRRSSRRRVT